MNSLRVIYNGKFVGVCDFNPENKKVFFQYSPAFERNNRDSDINIADLLDVANVIYFHKENETIPLSDYHQSLSTLLRIGSSVGGARAKALNEELSIIFPIPL